MSLNLTEKRTSKIIEKKMLTKTFVILEHKDNIFCASKIKKFSFENICL